MACSSLSRNVLDDFVSLANESIFMKLIVNEKDLHDDNDDNCFHPEFTHQFFGDSESIFGYRQLKVRLYYSASRLSSFLSIKYNEKVIPDTSNGLEADNVLKIIADKVEGHFYFNIDEFSAILSKESSFKPYGELLKVFSIDDRVNDTIVKRQFEVYKSDVSIPGFRAYHERMQTFLLWFIDAASYIDTDDDRWDFFVIYEKVSSNGTSVSNGHVNDVKNCVYQFVGYTTVYRYYAYPQKTRPRISQCLVLPPFQKKGIGAHMLQIIYDFYCNDNTVLDITVEDPSDNFTRLRDFVDAKNCAKLESFKTDYLKKGWNEEMAKEAQNKLKISKKQARRVYEILRLRSTNMSNPEEYRAYRLNVKQRLNAPFERQRIDYNKLEKCGFLSAPELKATLLSKDLRIDQLQKEYKELEDDYRHIIERLSSE